MHISVLHHSQKPKHFCASVIELHSVETDLGPSPQCQPIAMYILNGVTVSASITPSGSLVHALTTLCVKTLPLMLPGSA